MVEKEMVYYPDLDKVEDLILQAIKSYGVLRKIGKHQEADDVRAKIKEMKFAQKHLHLVMNLDFNKPSPKMLELAKEANIDLKNEQMVQEFKLVQIQNLEDIRRLRMGLKPLSKEEIEAQRQKLVEELRAKNKYKVLSAEQKDAGGQVERKEAFTSMQQAAEDSNFDANWMDTVLVVFGIFLWALLIFYVNFLM